MTDLDIETAFEVQLSATAQTIPIDVAYPNVVYVPRQGRPFIKPILFPGRQSSVGIGTDTRNRHLGIYQIGIWQPSSETKGPIQTVVNALKSVFKRGTVLELGELKVRILRFRLEAFVEDSDWVTQFVRIEYRADLEN